MASTSIQLTSSGPTVTANFQSNDTLVITVTAANYGTGISASVTPNGACTVSSTTVAMGSSVTVTPDGTGSYSVFFFIYGGKGGTSNSGTVSGTISSATDTTPDQFTFTDVTGVSLSTTQTSNQITVAGMSSGATTGVVISGGTYSKNGGAYTSSTAGGVVNGDTFRVRHTSSSSYNTSVNTTLTIGGVSDVFTSTTTGPDTTPDQFTFTDVTGVARSSTSVSNEITVAGLDGGGVSTGVSVTGGEYSKNGLAYTSSGGTAVNGDTFRVRHTTSSSFSTATDTTLNIGGVTDTYTSTTLAADSTPDGFSFTDVTGVSQSTTQTSNTITISGINTTASVSVTGGTYSKNGGAYTSSAGTAVNGDTFAVRHTSGSDFSISTSTTLTVGGISDTYTSTTAAFTGSTYYVDVFASYEQNFIAMSVSGTGASTSASSPTLLDAGDRVGFKLSTGSNVNTATAGGFNSGHWTNTAGLTLTSSYQYKYAKSGISTTINDAVELGAQSGGLTETRTVYFRGDSGVTAPVISNVTTDNAAAADVTATVNLSSNGSGGTLKYAQTTTNSVPATGWQTSASFTHPRGTTRYYWASQDEDTNFTYDGPKFVNIGYLLPDRDVAATSSTITGSATSAATTVSNGDADDTYAVRVNDGTVNLGTRTGNGSISFSSSLPSGGNSTTYEIFARRPTSTGGNGTTFYQTNDTFTVTRELTPTAPTNIVFSADPGDESATVSITATASGGLTGTLQVSEDDSTWVANGSSFTFTRGSAKTIYARRINGSTPSTSYSESNTIGYLSPDLAVAATSSVIAYDATSATTTISGGQADENYAVRLNNGSTNIETRLGNGDISFTTDLPAQGVSTTYEIFAQLPTNIGGSGSYIATNDTFTVERQVVDNIPDQFTFTDVTGAALSTTQTSNEITISGVQVSAAVSITGGNYSKNGAAYTNVNTTAANGDTFRVRHTSSGSFSTATNTTLTIGGVSDTYTSTTLAADTTPDAFTFTDRTAVARSTTQTSNTITVGGLNTSTSVSITGGDYSKNGGAYTSANTTAVNGNTFTVRHTSSASFSTAVNTTLNIGGVTDTFTSTTLAIDTTPNAFTFTDVTGVAINTTQTSNTITVSGINTSVAVSVSGGTYSKNGGAYTTSAGTAVNGDTFSVRHTSSSSHSTAVNTTLNIGGVTDTYTSTTAAFTGSTYYVDAIVTADFELNSLFMFVSGTGYSSSSTSPILLEPGDRVGFRVGSGSDSSSSVLVGGFASTHWTSTGSLTLTSSYQYKYASSSIPVSTADSVSITASRTNFFGTSANSYYMGDSVAPDLTISLDDDVYEISTSDTSHTIVISNVGDSTNSSITEYRVKDSSGSIHESRTGPGSLTVTDVPPNPGFPEDYFIEARVTTANGGSGLWKGTNTNYEVIATVNATQNDPTIDAYGVAIYDHNGNAITSFTEGHSVLREIYSNSSVTLSTSAVTDVSTGLTGITTSNCVISVTGVSGSGAESASQVAATFVGTNPVSVRLARVTSATTVKVTVLQYQGTTIGTTGTYGFQVRNGDNDVVIDENSTVYGVREIIALNPSASNQTLYTNEFAFFLYVELTQGRYPASGGLPIPAISSSKSVLLMPPTISGVKHTDGSYKTVICYIPKAGTINGNYNLAMLVAADNETPSYFGGSEPDYGIELYDTSNNVIWHSGWQQAIVNNVISANQFTAGTNQNGTYDVTTGRDGVSPPFQTTSDFDIGLDSTGQLLTLTGLNDMDPSKTYLAGSSLTGSVAYYKGFYQDFEFGTSGYAGGGLHKPAIKIKSFDEVQINMYKYSDGPTPPTSNDYGQRVSTSYHPEGNYILFRIV